MWLILFLLFSTSFAHKCCPTCACGKTCIAPNIEASILMDGLHLNCRAAECGCVLDELDTCTYGQTWQNKTVIAWKDQRWNSCIRIQQHSPLRATAIIRWWHDSCIGHSIIDLNIELEPIQRDVYIDFNVIAYYEHNTIYNTFRIQTRSGSNDVRPIGGSSTMFFEAFQPFPAQGVHVEITNCTVQMLDSTNIEATVLKEYNVFDVNTIRQMPGGQRLEYQAFWDGAEHHDCGATDCTNSPFQRLLCSYALFNGTDSNKTILHNQINRTYMIANPDETGVLINN